MNIKLISICIPSYNRPEDLKILLESVDSKQIGLFEVVICEDDSPKRKDIRDMVANFISI